MPRDGIMLCYPFEEKRFNKWGNQAIVQPKLNGLRCRAIKSEYGVDLISSEGNRFNHIPHINEQLNHSDFKELDGELYVHGMSLEDINSICKRTVNRHPNFLEMEFHTFDTVSEEPQIKRLSDLHNTVLYDDNIKPVKFKIVTSMVDIERQLDIYLEQGYEGFIARHIAGDYVRRRSIEIMKCKPQEHDEYKIVGHIQEMTIHKELKNSLGALILDAGYNNGTTFNVGTGFTHKDRKHLWEIKNTLKGKICKVKYYALSNKNGVPVPAIYCEVIDEKKM